MTAEYIAVRGVWVLFVYAPRVSQAGGCEIGCKEYLLLKKERLTLNNINIDKAEVVVTC